MPAELCGDVRLTARHLDRIRDGFMAAAVWHCFRRLGLAGTDHPLPQHRRRISARRPTLCPTQSDATCCSHATARQGAASLTWSATSARAADTREARHHQRRPVPPSGGATSPSIPTLAHQRDHVLLRLRRRHSAGESVNSAQSVAPPLRPLRPRRFRRTTGLRQTPETACEPEMSGHQRRDQLHVNRSTTSV